MSIDLLTANFQDVSRDDLRILARAHDVRGLTSYGKSRAVYDSTKDDLARGMEAARKQGKFGSTAPSTSASNGNITVKAQNVVLFLQGKGCHESGTYYVGAEAFKDGRVRLANCETDDPDDVDDLGDYDNFWTTLDDLRDLVSALTQYANES